MIDERCPRRPWSAFAWLAASGVARAQESPSHGLPSGQAPIPTAAAQPFARLRVPGNDAPPTSTDGAPGSTLRQSLPIPLATQLRTPRRRQRRHRPPAALWNAPADLLSSSPGSRPAPFECAQLGELLERGPSPPAHAGVGDALAVDERRAVAKILAAATTKLSIITPKIPLSPWRPARRCRGRRSVGAVVLLAVPWLVSIISRGVRPPSRSALTVFCTFPAS